MHLVWALEFFVVFFLCSAEQRENRTTRLLRVRDQILDHQNEKLGRLAEKLLPIEPVAIYAVIALNVLTVVLLVALVYECCQRMRVKNCPVCLSGILEKSTYCNTFDSAV